MRASLRLNNSNALQIFQLLRFSAFFITGMGLAKSGLSLAEIGTFETLMFISGILSFFWVSGSLNALLSTYDRNESSLEQGSHIFNAFLVLLCGSVLLFILLRLFETNILSLLTGSEDLNYFRLFTWYILLNNPLFLLEYICLLKDKFRTMVVYGTLNFLAVLAAVLIPVYSGYSLQESIYSLVLLAIVKFLFLIYYLSKYSVVNFSSRRIAVYLSLASPLIVSLLLSGSAEYIDQWMVSKFLGNEQLAIFRYGAKELPVSLLLANALSIAMIPFLKEKKLDMEALTYMKKRSVGLMHLLFPISILLMLTSKSIYAILFSSDFLQSAEIFNVYLLLLCTRILFPQSILLAEKQSGDIFKAALIEIILNVSISFFLLQKMGIIGIAWGTIIAYFIEKFVLILIVFKKQGISPEKYIAIKPLLLYSTLLFSAYILVEVFQ